MSEQTQKIVDIIRKRLQATVRRITLAELTLGLVLTLGILAAVWGGSAAVEAGFWLGTGPRAVFFWALVVLAAGLFVYFLLIPGLRLAGLIPGPTEEAVARRIGRRYPEVSDRMVNLLDLVEGRHSSAPGTLIDEAVRSLGEQIDPVPFEHVEDFSRVRRVGRLASLPIVGVLLFLLFAPNTFLDASKRLLSPGTAYQRPAPFQLIVTPATAELVKGDALPITVRVEGTAAPDQLTLDFNNLGEETVEAVPLLPDSTGQYHHTVVNVRRSMRFRAAAGPVTTPWYPVTVIERPIVRGLQVSLDFPRYTRIPPQRLEPNVGDVTALPGTRVSLEVGTAGSRVAGAFIRHENGRLDTLAVEASGVSGAFTLRRAGSYQVLLRNADGITNSDPITYQLSLLADARPAIVLLAPEPTAVLNERLQAGLRMRINDDFGFRRLHLHYRMAESRFGEPDSTFRSVPLPLDDPRLLDQEVAFDWALRETDLDPVPGDVIEYYVEVWDNDAVAGYKSSTSATQRLRLPSLAEQYEELGEAEDAVEDRMEDLLRETDTIREQFEELRDELRRKPEADWEDERQLEQLQQRQETLEQSVEELTEQVESVTEQMEENSLVSEETLEMFQDLQQVVEEIDSPEMRDALRQLEEAMQQLNLQQMQQSLENFQFNEQQYQQRLERALELFKNLRVQQELEEAARRAEEIARQEEQLAEETGRLMEEENEGEQNEGEQNEGEQNEGEQNEGEQNEGEETESDQNEGDQNEGEQNEGEQTESDQNEGEQSDNEQLARKQEMTKEEAEQLQQLMEQIQERMEELRNAPQQQMQQLNQEMQQQQLPEQMQENAEQLRNKELQDAQQGQQQMQQQMQQMMQQMQQMQQQMQGAQQQMNMAGLRRALNDILVLSQQQEDLRTQVRGLAADSPALRGFAQQQVELSEGLSVVSDSLQALAKNIPQMTRDVQQHAGEALREMGSATEALAERVARRAGGHQKGSMTHLNELALLLSDLLNQMMNGQGSGSGSMSMQQMMQQLQEMAGQQQQLNQQIQQMLNDMQGNRLTQDMQSRIRQMAGQQQGLQRQLKEMSRNRELRNNALGDLERIAEQMQESIEELQQNQVNRRTVQRQQQILTRLLDASRSMQERGRENRREGRQGREYDRAGPDALTPSEQADKLRRDLLRALDSGYAPDYEELIKRYFELLQQQSQGEQ